MASGGFPVALVFTGIMQYPTGILPVGSFLAPKEIVDLSGSVSSDPKSHRNHYVYVNVCLRVQYEIYFASHFIFVNYLHECVARVQIMTKM